jgi:hypothetical protein
MPITCFLINRNILSKAGALLAREMAGIPDPPEFNNQVHAKWKKMLGLWKGWVVASPLEYVEKRRIVGCTPRKKSWTSITDTVIKTKLYLTNCF